MADRDGPPWVAFPERLDRRLRLGPFASGRDAVKFVTAAAVGAIVSLAVVPWAGLPIAAAGAIIALWRPDGDPVDERIAAVVRWSARRSGRERPMTGPVRPDAGGGRATVALPDGRAAAILRTGGVPLAFLPPTELARQFDSYRQLLRSVDGGLILLTTAVPIYPDAIVPRRPAGLGPECTAYDGYRELVMLLARRRSVRRVQIALVQDLRDVDAGRRLEALVSLLQERLADLGVRSERLRGRPLSDAARRLGFIDGGRAG